MSEPTSKPDHEQDLDPTDPIPDSHVKATDDQQIVYYEGSPRLRGELGTLMLWTALGLVLIGVPLLLTWTDTIHSYWPLAVGIVLGLLCWIIPSILVRRNYYRITNYRIDYEHGILFKTMDTLELWHVEDVSLRQSPIDRIFNVGTITIVSADATNPRLLLKSLDSPRKLLETLKTRIISVKRQRGVVKLDMG
jgi:membrane protein YdbS with pleckstrin-like domain